MGYGSRAVSPIAYCSEADATQHLLDSTGSRGSSLASGGRQVFKLVGSLLPCRIHHTGIWIELGPTSGYPTLSVAVTAGFTGHRKLRVVAAVCVPC